MPHQDLCLSDDFLMVLLPGVQLERRMENVSDPITEFEKELQQKTPQELEELLAYHNRKYWIDNDPEISDEAYDALVRA